MLLRVKTSANDCVLIYNFKAMNNNKIGLMTEVGELSAGINREQ